MESTPWIPGVDTFLTSASAAAPLLRIDVIIDNPNELGLVLDRAVQKLIPAALERRQGILVSQILPDTYAVEVHETVQCGMIQEKRKSLSAHDT